jgi:hypothetical protein
MLYRINKSARRYAAPTAAAVLMLAVGMHASAQTGEDPTRAAVPSIADASLDTRRALVLEARIDGNDSATVLAVGVSESPMATADDPPLFRVDAYDEDGQQLSRTNAWDPRWEFVRGADGHERRELLADAVGEFAVPFDYRIAEIRVTDQNVEDAEAEPVTLLRQDVRATVRQFCLDNGDDPNCEGFSDVADADGDGVADSVDNCPETSNPDQADFDGDGNGDRCDGDIDGDLVSNTADSCPRTLVPEPLVVAGSLGRNRWGLAAGGEFEQAAPLEGSLQAFDAAATGGCSCEQIAARLGLGYGVAQRGCPTGILVRWSDGLQ